MTDLSAPPAAGPDADEWRTYDEFAAGIDTYRLPNVPLDAVEVAVTLDDGTRIHLAFAAQAVTWSATGSIEVAAGTRDPYDAVAVRGDIRFVNLPRTSAPRESLTLVWSTATGRALAVRSVIADDDGSGEPLVRQTFHAGTLDGVPVTGETPSPSRDLIGRRNLYRYSPDHLYEHVYLSSRRYSWQCLEGVQRGHGDTDLSTVWRFAPDLYLFCFREFRIAVASVWLHDMGAALQTTGVFLGLDGAGRAEHSRAGGRIIPLGQVVYPDTQPV